MILVLYFPIYMLWFNWLERRQVPHFAMIHCRLDDMIPFCEWFAIPYFLWFLYVFVSIIFLFLQSKHMSDFYRCSAVLMLGMTTCLIIYTIFPNAQPLRPDVMPRDNFLTRIAASLYEGDTPTNVCPSIHVYNSIAIHVALFQSYALQNKKGWKTASLDLSFNHVSQAALHYRCRMCHTIIHFLLYGRVPFGVFRPQTKYSRTDPFQNKLLVVRNSHFSYQIQKCTHNISYV